MPAPAVNTNALTILRDFGEQLRRARLQAGYTQAQAARKLRELDPELKISQDKISYLERGDRWPDDEVLHALLGVYRVPPVDVAAILATMRAGKSIERPWWDTPRVRALFDGKGWELFAMEDSASKCVTHAGTYPPGLLQTKGFIQAIAEWGQKYESTDDRATFVWARLQRQQVLRRKSYPLMLHAYMLESALQPIVGGPEVMREQLQYLREAAQWPNVTLRVIPFTAGAVAAQGTPFSIFDFPGEQNKPVLNKEMDRSDNLTDGKDEVRRARRKLADFAEVALDPIQSIHRIEKYEKAL